MTEPNLPKIQNSKSCSSRVKIYNSLVSLNGNLMAAVDLETTGLRPGYHEIIQIAVVPLDSDFKPLADVRPFYTHIRPLHPERTSLGAMQKNKIPMEELLLTAPMPDRVADWLYDWFEKLQLPFQRRLVPLAHNWPFDSAFLKAWLGAECTEELFHAHARDAMLYAIGLNDKAACAGEPLPFNRVGLGSLCNQLHIINTNPHDALADCLATAEVYRALLQRY